MKKVCAFIISCGMIFLLTACAPMDYGKAQRAMEAGDYQAAIDLFGNMQDYRDSAAKWEECRQLAAYNAAVGEFEAADYESAYDAFSELDGYADSEDYMEKAEAAIAAENAENAREAIREAITDRNADALCAAVTDYLNMEYADDTLISGLNDFAVSTAADSSEDAPYEYYLFLDAVAEKAQEDGALWSSVGERISDFSDTTGPERAKAFLLGDWVRKDTSASSGLKIRVVSERNKLVAYVVEDLAYLTDDKKALHWSEGMTVWDDIRFTDEQSVEMYIMRQEYMKLYLIQGSYYDWGIGRFDYDNMRIITQSPVTEGETWQYGTDSIVYVKQSAAAEAAVLTDADYEVVYKEPKEDGKSPDIKKLCTEKDDVFWSNGTENCLTTSRGITVGSTYEDVINAYGYGNGNLYIEKADEIFRQLKGRNIRETGTDDALCGVLSEQADEYMEYTYEGGEAVLRLYFKDGIVTWICWLPN